MGKTSF